MIPVLFSLGISYILALGFGRIAASLGVPRVTGYLLTGLIAGPSLAKIIGFTPLLTFEQLETLTPVHDIALGLIVLVIGGSFKLQTMRNIGSKLSRVSLLEMSLTGLIVGVFTYFAGASFFASGFLAIMAITTAPAATQMVVREYESEGTLTELVMTLIGVNNLVAIVLFVAFSYLAITPDKPVFDALYKIVVPFGIGIVTGGGMAVMDQRLARKTERQIMALGVIAGLVGLCVWLDVSSMLATLITGAVLVNASPHEKRILTDMKDVDYPLYVIFFLMAGAHLHIDHLSHMGAVGIAYILARTTGKIAGNYLGAKWANYSKDIQLWIGPSMLAQAGLAIGLSSAIAKSWPGQGAHIQTAVLASVVIFEGIGPLLTRIALVRVGEVTVLSLLSQRSPVSYGEGLHQVINQFADAIGITGLRKLKGPQDILIEHIMRRNVETVLNSVKLDIILKTFGHSRYDRLPVVNGEKELVGVIQYSDVADVMFDPTLRSIIVASDIVTHEHLLLTPEDTLETAMSKLKEHSNHTYLMVVDKMNSKKLVGVVRHNDLLSAQRRIKI
ncbi:MAG: cation:proton antiporter [Deltaproteobacteria bacterium]|nr:cation:proton antiporter [Deltaproteobacteria bacterium]